jgi:hypothetical protein
MSEMWIHPGLKAKNSGVNLQVNPAFRIAAPVLKTAWRMHNAECIVTSAKDGSHGANSAHYTGNALDLRTWNIPMDVETFSERLSEALVECCGPEWYVVLEDDHIHLEFSTGVPNIKGWVKGKNFYVQQ